MRRFTLGLTAFLIMVTLILTLLAREIRPSEPLDLSYTDVPIGDKYKEILRSRRPEIVLTEEEVGNLLKKELTKHVHPMPNVEIRGASFQLQSDRLLAKVNARYGGMLDIEADLVFILRWNAPYLTAVHQQTSIKSYQVPASLFRLEPFSINIEEQLPRFIAIRDVVFAEREIKIALTLNNLPLKRR